jgi:hypothetical protein
VEELDARIARLREEEERQKEEKVIRACLAGIREFTDPISEPQKRPKRAVMMTMRAVTLPLLSWTCPCHLVKRRSKLRVEKSLSFVLLATTLLASNQPSGANMQNGLTHVHDMARRRNE